MVTAIESVGTNSVYCYTEYPYPNVNNAFQTSKKMLSDYNTAHPDSFPLNIACGYELYAPDEDYDIGDTLRRADKIMYNEKFEMKKKNNEQVR